MAQVKDPVCGMMVDSDTAPARSTHNGNEYFFCTAECRDQFEMNPARYMSDAADVEKHDPKFQKDGPLVTPKFGSAGSGGLEFEPGPERHGKK
jgi:YHS domain-containing protein